MALVVAGVEVEGGGEVRVGERVGAGVEQFGLEAFQSPEVPGGVEQAPKRFRFEGGFGADVSKERGFEFGEFVTFVFADDQVNGGEAVLAGVLGGAGLAFGGSGAGGS